jgi:alpha/beta superfamily hydrolase
MSADGGHLGWRSGSLDIILKVDHLRTIHAMFALNWLTGFVFGADLKSNMAARVHNVFSLAEILKILSETTKPIEL